MTSFTPGVEGSAIVVVLPADFLERLSRRPGSDDPHAHLRPLLDEAVAHLRTGELVLARHADVVEVLRNPTFVKPSFPPVPFRSARTLLRMFLLLNAPDHPRLRRAVAPVFSPAATERRRARILERAEALLAGRDALDVIAELAYPLPLGMITDALGVLPGDERRVSAWGVALLETLDNPMPLTPRGALRMAKAVALRRSHPIALLRAIRGMVRYAGERLDRDASAGATSPDADILRALRAARDEGSMSRDEAIATWVLVVVAGHETTANLIGTTMHLLLEHPDQLAAVSADPSLVPQAVREALRLESPVPMGIRVAAADTSVGGQPVPAGTTALALIGSANRDPAVFDEPDRFDIMRTETDHVAFGHGSHFCLGAQLALLEAEVAVAALVHRAPRLAPGFTPRWRPTFATRGVERLPVVF